MKARVLMGPIRPHHHAGSRKVPLIPLDYSLRSTGSFQILAELERFIGGTEWANHGPVVSSLFAEVSLLNHGGAGTEHGWIFALQRLVGGASIGIAPLR